jgi:hypothetical protein
MLRLGADFRLIPVRPMRRALTLLLVAATLTPLTLWSATPDFASAQSVEAFRVAPRWEKHKTSGKIFREQKVISGPRLLPHASARAIAEELQRVYRADWPPLYCAFVARYGLRVRLGTKTVEVLVCPHCGEVQFYAGKHIRSASVSSELLRILQSIFSDYPLRPNEV